MISFAHSFEQLSLPMFKRKCREFPINVNLKIPRIGIKVWFLTECDQFLINSQRNSNFMGKMRFSPFYFLVISCLTIISAITDVQAKCQFEPDGVSKFCSKMKWITYYVAFRRHFYRILGQDQVTFGVGVEENSTENVSLD